MFSVLEEIHHPVVHPVGKLKHCYFLHERTMPNRVECLTEVEAVYDDILIRGKKVRYSMQEGDDCSCGRACRTEGELIREA